MTRILKNDKSGEQLELFDKETIASWEKVWNAQDVANYLGTSVGHVYNLKAQGKIPYRKRGKLLRFIPNEIIDWLNQGGI